MKNLLLLALPQLFLHNVANSFIPHITHPKPFIPKMAIEPISLENLGTDHESVASKMKESIISWLDAEWIPQEVHIQMASSAQQTYVSCRENGEDDVAEIMLRVVDDLNDDWKKFDKDAFVNAWDIGNYVADYLSNRAGVEGCACSASIHD